MAFYKAIQQNKYSKEVKLNDEEEREVELLARAYNVELMRQFLEIAEEIIRDEGLKEEDRVQIALVLFEKEASHAVYWKERACRMKLEAKRIEIYKKY